MIHKELLTSLNSKLKKNYDLLIVSASFEDRCTSILQHVDQARVKDVLVFYNEEFSQLPYQACQVQKCWMFSNSAFS